MSYSFYFFLILALFLVFVGWLLKCIIDFKNHKISTIENTTTAIGVGVIFSVVPLLFILYSRNFYTIQYSNWSFWIYLILAMVVGAISNKVWDRQATAIQNKEPMGAKRLSFALGWGLLNSFLFYLIGSSFLLQLGNSDFHSETTVKCKIVEARESYSKRHTTYHYCIEPINERWEESLRPINKDSIEEMDLFTLDLTQRMCVPLVHMLYSKNDAIEFKSDYKNYKRQNELIGDTIEVGFLKGYFGDIAEGQNLFFTEE